MKARQATLYLPCSGSRQRLKTTSTCAFAAAPSCISNSLRACPTPSLNSATSNACLKQQRKRPKPASMPRIRPGSTKLAPIATKAVARPGSSATSRGASLGGSRWIYASCARAAKSMKKRGASATPPTSSLSMAGMFSSSA